MTRAAILFVLGVLLSPVLILLMLFVSFTAGEFLCSIIYRGQHEGISDLCRFLTMVIFFAGMVAAAFTAFQLLWRRWRLR